MPILCTCPDLLAPEERGDGDEVAGEPADQEHHAAEEGGHQHPVRVVLTYIAVRLCAKITSVSVLSSQMRSSNESVSSLFICHLFPRANRRDKK